MLKFADGIGAKSDSQTERPSKVGSAKEEQSITRGHAISRKENAFDQNIPERKFRSSGPE